MSRRFSSFMSLIVVLMIGASACGGSAGDEVAERVLEQQPGVQNVEIDDTSMTVSLESEEGEISMEMGTGELLEGFPFPVPDGCVVVGHSRWKGPDGVAIQAGLEFPPGQFEIVVSFYEDFLEGEGFEIIKTVTGTETDTMVMLLAEGPEATASVVASRSEGGGTANLNWGPPPSTS